MFEQIDNNESCLLKNLCPGGKETIDQQESILPSAVTSSPVATNGPCCVIVKKVDCSSVHLPSSQPRSCHAHPGVIPVGHN